ncbi:hypothetical protein LINPERHAP2_LOCUS31300 [Linum perenne]
MALVQRLTGTNSNSSNPFGNDPGAMSQAARYATIEKARSLKDKAISANQMGNGDFGDFFMEGVEMGERLPPGPTKLVNPGRRKRSQGEKKDPETKVFLLTGLSSPCAAQSDLAWKQAAEGLSSDHPIAANHS